jgi:hypothetical protein
MTTRSLACLLATSLILAGAAVAPAQTGTAKITPAGVGKVKLGAKWKKLNSAGLVGRLRKGCELAGPGTRSARLRAPLKGSVELTHDTPRRVTTISISGGATARGVGVGDSLADIEAAYPKAKVDHGTEWTFGITLVRIPKSGGGKLEFAVDTQTGEVDLIGIPRIPFCD